MKTMKTEKWVVVRDTTSGGGEQNLSSGLKVPRHCPFVLLVIVSFKPVLLKFKDCRLLGYKTQFVPHRRHITSPLQSPAS
jgi:hypothetical protein